MTEKELSKFYGKRVRVKSIRNITIEGVFDTFTPALDNDLGIAEIGITRGMAITSLLLPDIKSIETI